MTHTFLSALPWLGAGALIGGLYWLTLRWTAEMLGAGKSLARPVALQVVRLAGLGAVLAGVAIRGGALALLAMAGGLLVARAVILRRAGRE